MPSTQKSPAKQAVDDAVQLINRAQRVAGAPPPDDIKTSDVDAEITRRRRLQNDDVEQNIRLKRVVLNRLFWFLGIETFLIFAFTFCQATKLPLAFELPEWSFNILVTATILQIAAMLLVAVRYLFPNKEG